MNIRERLDQNMYIRLQQNIDEIDLILGAPSDLQKKEFIIGDLNLDAALIYLNEMVNDTVIDKSILAPLIGKQLDKHLSNHEERECPSLSELAKSKIYASVKKEVQTFQEAIDSILNGDTVLLLDQCEHAVVLSTSGGTKRSIDEPQTEPVIRGPRDGFVESIGVNIALVRRRIKDPMLRMQSMNIGQRSKTSVAIAYIEGIVKDGLVDEVLERLKRIKIDAILESGYIEELIDDAPTSPFITVQGTERPDKVASGIYEGRVAIFVDNTPFVLLVPTHFWQFLDASDDHYSHYWMGTFFRIIRYLAFMISLSLPSLYVMLIRFHQEMLPTPLAITIAAGREVVPLPVVLEALVMEFAFELMREAGLRMPKPIGQAVSIVGSLIIGQAAVEAGLVSPAMVIIVATTGIASFVIPNYAASFSVRLLRFPLLLASGALGLLGFSVVFVVLLIHAISLRSFGEPYLSPVMPLNSTELKDSLLRAPLWTLDERPSTAKGDERREGDNQKPSPKR
ncbi:spore germination protein [Halalkalibacter urbisdiaboli]|uniref:spore germination protein n=1 Tax=Halalkalibacter urbisdiaboli TaxID=1960589 RepID=UPI001FD92E53|nr:spore germination protein [Halalkalibacter urbisdiaboli]